MATRRTPKRKSKAPLPKSPQRGAPTKPFKATVPSRSMDKAIGRLLRADPQRTIKATAPSRSSRSVSKALKTAAAKAATPRRRKAREAASVGRGTKITSRRSPSRSIRGKSVSRKRAGGTPSRRMN